MLCAKCGKEYKETIFSDCPDFNCPSCKAEKPRETFNIDKAIPDVAIKGILDKIARQGGNEIRKSVVTEQDYKNMQEVMIGYADTKKMLRQEYPLEESGIKPIDMKPVGIKHDAEKLRWSLLPLREVEEVVKVLMHGSKKYADNNWMHVKPKERYIDAALRHLTARMKGEILDPESGFPHVAHFVCCGLFLLWHDKEDGSK